MSPPSTDRATSTKVVGFGFAVVIVLMLTIAAMSLVRLERIQTLVGEINESHSIHVQLAHRMYHAARERSYLLTRIAIENDAFVADELMMRFHSLSREFLEARQQLVTQDLVTEELALLEKQRLATLATVPIQQQIIDLVLAGKRTQAEELLARGALLSQEEVLLALAQFIELQNRQINAASRQATEQVHQTTLYLLMGTVLAALLSSFIALYVQRNMSRLMQGLSDKSEQLRISLRDIIEHQHAEQALQRLAETDSLTGIANRRKFDEMMHIEINRAQRHTLPLTLILLDLDHFKALNDTHGHQIGDAVLIEFARLVARHIRSHDFFARWGGEEFAILATHSDSADTLQFADKLRLLIAEHSFANVGHITASLGLSSLQTDDSIEALLGRADSALYAAKHKGRNRVESL